MATVAKSPDSNRQAKSDKLAVATFALAAFEPQKAPPLTEPLRQAYAAAGPADLVPSVSAPVAAAPVAPPKPKVAAKLPVQKNYALLSDVQIAGHQGTAEAVARSGVLLAGRREGVARHRPQAATTKQADPAAGMPPIDPDSDEVQQLKSAAMPLLFQLREDQKNEVRTLARIIGLERVASMI